MHDLRWYLFIPFCGVAYQYLRSKDSTWSSKSWAMLYACLVSILAISAVTKFLAFEVNGVDFSVFDWMLHNTTRGQFMWSPFCDCNHFGVHPTWLFLTLVPIHAFWQSPWILILSHIASLGLLLPWTKQFIRSRSSAWTDPQIGLILISLTASQAMGSIANYGFHPESWYLAIGLWFLTSWTRPRFKWILPSILFAAVKEDGAFYLAGWATASLLFKETRSKSLILLLGAVGFFIINTKLLQPMAWANPEFKPSWSNFWGRYGTTPSEVAKWVLLNPAEAFWSILSSGSWTWFIPFLFLPLVSIHSFLAILPGLVMLSLANSKQLQGLSIYYAAPILPFAMYGWTVAVERIERFVSPSRFKGVFLCFVALLGFVGGVGPRMGKMKPTVKLSLQEWIHTFRPVKDVPTCVQTALYPHLGYLDGIVPLVDETKCASGSIYNSLIDPYPFKSAEEIQTMGNGKGWIDLELF